MLQNLDIFCERDRVQRKMPMRYEKVNGNILYAPCNGCDFLNGSEECKRCCKRVDAACLHVLSEPVLSLIDLRIKDA